MSVANDTEAVVLGEEMIDEETVLKGEPLNDATVIELDVMVDLRRGVTTSRGAIRGRPHAASAHCSGPHWPREGTESIEARDLPRRRIRWLMGVLPFEGRPPTERGARELIRVVPARNTCIRSVTNTHRQVTDQSLAPLLRRSSDP